MVLENFFDSIFGFVLSWPPLISIALASLFVATLTILATKYLTDQKEMKRLKEDMNKHRAKIKELKNEPEKMMAANKEAMSVNMEYMKKNFKVTFYTIIPLLLIFGWLSAHYQYEPLTPGQEFTLTAIAKEGVNGNVTLIVVDGITAENTESQFAEGKAHFKLSGDEGEYLATLSSGGQEIDVPIIISKEQRYAPVVQKFDSTVFASTELGNETLKIWKLGWIWIYIIFAIGFNLVLKRVFVVH